MVRKGKKLWGKQVYIITVFCTLSSCQCAGHLLQRSSLGHLPDRFSRLLGSQTTAPFKTQGLLVGFYSQYIDLTIQLLRLCFVYHCITVKHANRSKKIFSPWVISYNPSGLISKALVYILYNNVLLKTALSFLVKSHSFFYHQSTVLEFCILSLYSIDLFNQLTFKL